MGSLLTICQDAAGRLGLEELNSIASSSNQTARRLRRAANASGRALARRANWQLLRKEHTFLTVDSGNLQTNATLPNDYDRYVQETGYNRTSSRPLSGPLTAQEWQAYKATIGSLAPTDSFYIRGNQILMAPIPNAGDEVAFEYMSKWWVDSGPTPDGVGEADRFSTDLDEALLDEEMMILDIMWRYKQSRGLPYAEDFRSAELMILDRISQDGVGQRRMDMLQRNRRMRPMPPAIPEGSWNLP